MQSPRQTSGGHGLWPWDLLRRGGDIAETGPADAKAQGSFENAPWKSVGDTGRTGCQAMAHTRFSWQSEGLTWATRFPGFATPCPFCA